MKKLFFVLLIIFSLSSCKHNKIEKEYYYARYDMDSIYGDENFIVGYTVRNYTYKKDTIIEKITYIRNSGKVIDVQKQKFIKKAGNLYALLTHKVLPYLIISRKDSCWIYEHPMFIPLRKCYRGDTLINKEKMYMLESACECIDGVDETLFLDKNFVLYQKIIHNSIPFNLEIRIDKNKFPFK